MHTKGKSGYKYRYKYGVAFPISFKLKALKNLPYDVCNKLNLYIFLVDSFGNVEKYSHKELMKIQSKK